MRESNIDAYYNHKTNQYSNKFIIELNDFIYSNFDDTYHKPTTSNIIIFISKGTTKISVDNKAVVPRDKPGLPIKTNVKSMSSSSIMPTNKGKKV